MSVSILDAHPNNECIDLSTSEAWFSFIFCGSVIDTLKLHVYDYYTGKEIVSGSPTTVYSPTIHTNLDVRGGVGNGVRVNIKDFVEFPDKIFKTDGEYTWRAELIQDHPDNMIYEGAIVGEPSIEVEVGNIREIDLDNFLPLSKDISKRLKPPYYVDFLDSKYNGKAYDIPVTYDEKYVRDDGTECTVIRLTTYTSTIKDTDVLLRPAIGTKVRIHKKKHYGNPAVYISNDEYIFIDDKISGISDSDKIGYTKANDGCYLKVSNKYYRILNYDKNTGAVLCQNNDELKEYPAGTHYSVFTSQFWTPYYYFRVHNMPKLALSAEFHEHRRMQKSHYDDSVNCLENTFNGVLFKAELCGEPHAAVKYFYWEIFDKDTDKRLLKTERIYSQEMDCEFFVPFGHTYTGRITVVTQDGITLSDKVDYTLPSSPLANDENFSLRAYQNKFGGIELAWKYNYWYDGGSLLKANQFEVFRLEKRINKLKYLGKVDCSPFGIDGVVPAASGHNWYLIDKDCNFKLKTPNGAKVNIWLVGGGCDGGGWTVTPNEKNKSFAVGQKGGEGGFVSKKTVICDSGEISGSVKVAPRNNTTDTSVMISGTRYKCNDSDCPKIGKTASNTMTQTSGSSVIYNDDAENGMNGVVTPYGIVGSSGGGGAACGGNRTSGNVIKLDVSGITLPDKYNQKNWVLIDRDSLGGETGSFELDIPEGVTVKMYLVGGGSDGTSFVWDSSAANDYNWDNNGFVIHEGYGGGCVLEREITVTGHVLCEAVIADANNKNGTSVTIDGVKYNCDDSGHTQRAEGDYAIARHPRSGYDVYRAACNGQNGVYTPCGYVGSSGGGGGMDNKKAEAKSSGCWNGAKGGENAGKGGDVTSTGVTDGGNAKNYGCGGGCCASKTLDYYHGGKSIQSEPGKGKPGCIIFEISSIADAPCPNPGVGGIGAGNGGNPGDDGLNAVNYGCGGGNAGYYTVDSDGNYNIGNAGKGKQGCVIFEIDTSGIEVGSEGEKVYAVDWTAASDKEYRYIVTGCNYESAYLGKETVEIDGEMVTRDVRHDPEEMIECSACVDITPHFEDFYIYFLDDADVLRDTKLNYENYETPLIETVGRYVTSKNNNYPLIKRHNHTLALERADKPYYRRHAWRIEGNVELGEITHNITRNVDRLYAQMPSVSDEHTNYDTFPMSFVLGYIDCDEGNGEFVYDDQYLFELWKKCMFEKKTAMIKDPKGNVWTGTFNDHNYDIEYNTYGMPYNIKTQFTQTRTEHNTRIMIVDSHNAYLKTAKGNHLK